MFTNTSTEKKPRGRCGIRLTIGPSDDTQVYISLSQSNAQESVSNLSDCLTDILFWMELSKLKLNPDKTDCIVIGTRNNEIRSLAIFQLNCLRVIHSHHILFVIKVCL